MTPTTPAGRPELPAPSVTSYTTDSVMRRYELHTFNEPDMHAYADACTASLRAEMAILQGAYDEAAKQCDADSRRIAELEAALRAAGVSA